MENKKRKWQEVHANDLMSKFSSKRDLYIYLTEMVRRICDCLMLLCSCNNICRRRTMQPRNSSSNSSGETSESIRSTRSEPSSSPSWMRWQSPRCSRSSKMTTNSDSSCPMNISMDACLTDDSSSMSSIHYIQATSINFSSMPISRGWEAKRITRRTKQFF